MEEEAQKKKLLCTELHAVKVRIMIGGEDRDACPHLFLTVAGGSGFRIFMLTRKVSSKVQVREGADVVI